LQFTNNIALSQFANSVEDLLDTNLKLGCMKVTWSPWWPCPSERGREHSFLTIFVGSFGQSQNGPFNVGPTFKDSLKLLTRHVLRSKIRSICDF